MDAQAHTEDPGGRGLLTVGLVVLAGTVGAAFGRVFEGSAPSIRLVLAAGAATLLAALFERRHLGLSVAVSLLGLALAVGIIVFPRSTWFGLPTPSTLEALGRALGNLGRHATNESTPAPALPSLFSASLIAVWAAAYSSHALAARSGSGILALVPPASLLAFAGVVADEGPRPGYAAAFLVASLAVLFAFNVRGVYSWGPVLPRRSRQSARLASGPPGRGARRLGLAVTAAALLLPGLLPGFRADGVLDLTARTAGRIAIRPLVDIRPSLLRDPAIELFTVQAERPAYWRLLSLDAYTGRVWQSTDPRARGGTDIQDARPLLSGAVGGRSLSQDFSITRLGGFHLPAAFTPVAVQGLGRTLRHDPDRTSLVIEGGLPRNLRYTVRSRTVSPSPEELDRTLDFSVVDEKYTALPADTPPEVFQVAREMTAGLGTPYRKALAIQRLLRTFTYDEEAPAGHGINDLLFFLQSQRGYCEQFAGTMSVLLRALGYPARVAVGFLPGPRDTSGVYHVSTEQAHAWVEMFFPGYGWLAFEPTPTRDNPVARPYLRGSPDGPGGLGQEAFLDPQEFGVPIGGLDARLRALERRQDWERSVAALDSDPERPAPLWRRVAPAAAGVVLLAIALVPLSKGWRRWRAVRRASSPRDRVLAVYDVFESRAADVGLGRRTGETLIEYAARLRSQVAFTNGHLERLAGLAGRALYAPDGVTPADAGTALVAGRLLAADIRRQVGRMRAFVGALRLRPPETGS